MAVSFVRTKTTDFFYKVNLIAFIFGLPNFWISDLKLPKSFIRIYERFNAFNNTLISILILLELGSFFTQHNLTEKQKLNLLVYGFSHPILFLFCGILARNKVKVRAVMYDLTVVLKRVHNDADVEKQMIKQTLMYLTALLSSCFLSMVSYSIDAAIEVFRKGVTFTTVMTVWPDVEDDSYLADLVRIFSNLVWWIFLTRVFGMYILVISLTTCLSHMYKNLHSYFYQLNQIFDRNEWSQADKEGRYETAFKVGIKLHSDTLKCTYQCQSVCGGVLSGQIIFNIFVVVILMVQMVGTYLLSFSAINVTRRVFKGLEKKNAPMLRNSERNLANLCAVVFTATAVLISTGFFMCISGDVTVEASHLATAMYLSGWHNCVGASSLRIRKLVGVSMAHAQKPVVLKGLGYLDLSYQSYITIVKTCYSVFSVLY